MKVTAYTPKGKVVLDLTDPKDIETFGGQEAVDNYIAMVKINERVAKNDREQAIAELKADGDLPADFEDVGIGGLDGTEGREGGE